ncbi:hypothetical protein Dda_3493 [Drechslerella dactyloides]|uniref:Uncharacterized protein n=1 Tax=Drechslerella dactyloides TaxID=74499 RepID=A0AAD6J5V4_DREDA|nr:hypothetical protein Dda_3493 [Drechslerella dactyloides]
MLALTPFFATQHSPPPSYILSLIPETLNLYPHPAPPPPPILYSLSFQSPLYPTYPHVPTSLTT